MQYIEVMLPKNEAFAISHGMHYILAYLGENNKLPNPKDKIQYAASFKRGLTILNRAMHGWSKTAIRRMVYSYGQKSFMCVGNNCDQRTIWRLHKRKTKSALQTICSLIKDKNKTDEKIILNLYASVCDLLLTSIHLQGDEQTTPSEIIGFPYYDEVKTISDNKKGYTEKEREIAKTIVSEFDKMDRLFIR